MKTYVDIGASFFRHPKKHIGSEAWQVHLIEPIQKYYEGNLVTYAENQNVVCHNFAISTFNGVRSFKVVDENKCKEIGYPVTNSLLGTVGFEPVSDDDVSRGSKLLQNYKKIYREIEVECKTFDQFALDNNIEKVDYLKTDTEGFDVEILNTVDFDKYEVESLKFEYKWSKSRDLKSYNSFIKKLTGYGFKQVYKDQFDLIYQR